MRYLLDTHTLLWWWTDDHQLSNLARELIADERNEIFVSAASAWGIATKHRLGKLSGLSDALPRFNELVQADGFTHLPISYLHALKSSGYPQPHRDPFDRVLAAQSELELMSLISCDKTLSGFNIKIVW